MPAFHQIEVLLVGFGSVPFAPFEMIGTGFGIVDFWGFDLAIVSGFCLPVDELISELSEGISVVGILGEVVEFVGIRSQVVQFFEGTCIGHDSSLGWIEFVLCVPLPHGLDDGFGVFVVVGLEVGSGGESVADVFPFFGSDASDPVDGFIGSISSGKDRLAGFMIWAEDILGVHSSGFWDTCQGKACGGKVDMFDEIIAELACRDVGSCDEQRHVGTAIVEELFVAHVADSVVGHEEDDGVV